MGLANWLKSLVLTAKSPFGVFLWKNGSFSELGYPGFIVFLVEDWVFYRFVTLRGDAFGKDYGFEFCGRQALKCDLVVKRLRCINCLIKCLGYKLCHFVKSKVVVCNPILFLYKKVVKQRTL